MKKFPVAAKAVSMTVNAVAFLSCGPGRRPDPDPRTCITQDVLRKSL